MEDAIKAVREMHRKRNEAIKEIIKLKYTKQAEEEERGRR